jgi:guanylate kinase
MCIRDRLNIKKFYGDDALAIFVQPPSVEELRRRLISRSTETEEKIQMRIAKANHELSFAGHFDAIITNNDLMKACNEAEEIIRKFTGS